MNPALRDRWLARAERSMAEAGLRAGAARSRVVAVMAEDGQCLVGARDVVDRLRDRGAVGSQASVYRVLDELTSLGLLRRSLDDQGLAQYEIDDAAHHHHHLVDEDTGRVEAFDQMLLSLDPAQGQDGVARPRRLPGCSHNTW